MLRRAMCQRDVQVKGTARAVGDLVILCGLQTVRKRGRSCDSDAELE